MFEGLAIAANLTNLRILLGLLLQFFDRERRRKDAKGRLGLLIHFEPRKNTEYTEGFLRLILHFEPRILRMIRILLGLLLQFFDRERRRKDAKGRLGLLIHFEPRKNTEYTEGFLGLILHFEPRILRIVRILLGLSKTPMQSGILH